MALIQAFAEFVRSTAAGERTSAIGIEPLLTVADAARYLSVSRTTVRNLAGDGKVRSTRVGDRIRLLSRVVGRVDRRRRWRGPGSAARAQATCSGETGVAIATRSVRRRAEPKPKPPTHIQRIRDQDMRLLAPSGRAVSSWHIGDRSPLCGASGQWTSSLQRWPRAYMCRTCITALAAVPEADLSAFGVARADMLRVTHRSETATPIRAGYHSGDGRRTP